jgi:hypothetical protein
MNNIIKSINAYHSVDYIISQNVKKTYKIISLSSSITGCTSSESLKCILTDSHDTYNSQ